MSWCGLPSPRQRTLLALLARGHVIRGSRARAWLSDSHGRPTAIRVEARTLNAMLAQGWITSKTIPDGYVITDRGRHVTPEAPARTMEISAGQ